MNNTTTKVDSPYNMDRLISCLSEELKYMDEYLARAVDAVRIITGEDFITPEPSDKKSPATEGKLQQIVERIVVLKTLNGKLTWVSNTLNSIV